MGERLLFTGAVTEQQVQQALSVQGRSNALIGQILVDLGSVSAPTVGQLLAETFGVRYVDLTSVPLQPEAVGLVPEALIRSMQALPFQVFGDTVEVAMTDPLNVGAIDRIHHLTGLRVVPCLTMAREMDRALNDLFDASARTTEVLEQLEAEAAAARPSRQQRPELMGATDAPIVRLVDTILESALALRASDIHFEPQERGLRVRYRVDGTLIEHTEIPAVQLPAVTARLKVLCVMDITESRRPQDGRMRHTSHGRAYDIRVSSVPSVYGEKMVLRILDKSSVLVPLSRLGFVPEQQARFEGLIKQPHGMVLVVGPTGSGKSTTLYSALNLLNDSQRNIMTLEDPVEYNVPGLTQVQVNARIGLTFASGMRSFVRQDPDVILVGEIRDGETAEMAVQASLTGHLLLSTLHTNSAVGTFARLNNLGLDPFLVAQSLTGVVSQRLVAKICPHCAASYEPDPEILDAVGISPPEASAMQFKKGAGCRICHGRGYQGRMGIYEVLVVTEEIRGLIMRGASEEEMKQATHRNGMRSLRESALIAVRTGMTTPEEMGRVVLTREAI